MNFNEDIDMVEDLSDDDGPNSPAVDDFIKELEEKEKDLDISADWSIEVSEADFDDQNIPDFLADELNIQKSASVPQVPSVRPDVGNNASTALTREVADLRARLAAADVERAELLLSSQRRMQDLENSKTRMERERSETFNNQIYNLAVEMLPVLDNLNRALDFAAVIPEEKRLEFSEFFDGIDLVNQQLNEIFAGMGVEPITSIGEDFDPHFHEAVATMESSDFPHNTIAEEMLRGYRIGNRVIRHSMVRVVTAVQAPRT